MARFYYIFIDAICGLIVILPFLLLYQTLFFAKRKGKKDSVPLGHTVMVLVFAFVLAGIFSATGIPTIQDFHYDPHMNLNVYFPLTGNMEQYFLNVLLFVPFGFFLPLIWKKFRFFPLCLWYGFLFSLAIEIAQLFNYRATDVEDVMMNTIGTVVGYVLFWLFKAVFFKTAERFYSGSLKSNGKEMMGCIAVAWCSMFFLMPFLSNWAWGLIY